jgi:hypothetical protein
MIFWNWGSKTISVHFESLILYFRKGILIKKRHAAKGIIVIRVLDFRENIITKNESIKKYRHVSLVLSEMPILSLTKFMGITLGKTEVREIHQASCRRIIFAEVRT